jgi:polysaccharide biosynthesis protein PelA
MRLSGLNFSISAIGRAAQRLLSLGMVAACVVGIATALAPSRAVRALDVEVAGRLVTRTVLAIYDSKQEGPPHQTRLHKLAEMPLNHLGFIVEYRDVNQPLPTVDELARYRGIITWFVEPLADPHAYVSWLEPATATGLRYVMLGEVAPRESDEMIRPINRILAPLGLAHGGTFIDLTYKSKVLSQDATMIGFEQKLDKALPGFPLMLQRSADMTPHLVIEANTPTGPQKAVVVATNARGGFAAQNFTVLLEPNTDRLGWVINPFAFFSKSLGGDRFPIPDVTTVSGRRIYFSQIDGDGWNNLSEVEGYRQTLSAEVVARELIAPFPDLPVSVGLIAGDVNPLLGGNPAGAAVARRLYAMPQVEVASHTHTHPYNWSFFETYDRGEEEKKIKSYRSPDQPLRERLTAALARAAGRTITDQRYDPYVAGSDDLPRTYLKAPFTLDLEVAGALKISENFAPKGKRAKLYLWSGDATPFEGAVAATRAIGVRNMNGGDSRFDPEFPSVAYVPSISRVVGRERQIYAVNSNENTYTNDWTGPFNGQALLVNTLKNTESPRRLKGFDLYYHMYSGEKQASLRTVRGLLEYARKSNVVPLDASQYAAMADDYFATEITQLGLFKWAIKKRGALETVRFDDAEHLSIDISDSQGVLGANRHLGALYVSLDPVVSEPIVTLRARSAVDAEAGPRADATSPPPPNASEPMLTLVEGRWRFQNRTVRDCVQTITAQGYGPGDMTFEGRRNRPFRIKVSRDSQTLNEEIRWTDANGRLALLYDIDAREPLQLTFACHE